MCELWDDLNDRYAPPVVVRELARIALAAMDSESGCLPLDYLQGHKDGLEWAAKLAEANHPETGDWLYDDPIELAKAIRKGPNMPPARPAPVVPDERDKDVDADDHPLLWSFNEGWNACRAAMLQAGTITNEGTKQAWTGIHDIDNAINMLDRIDTLESCDDDRVEAVKTVLRRLAGNSPVIPDGYVMVPNDGLIAELLTIAKEAADDADVFAYSEFNNKSMRHSTAIADWERRAAMLNQAQEPATYNTAPQPAVVSDEMIDTFEAEFRSAFKVSPEVKQMLEIGYHGEKFSFSIRDAATWWKLGRAAMLAAAPQSPGSEPATVPGKWIPVSERMPEREVDVQVYCPDKKEQMVAYLERNELEGYFRFATWSTGEGIYCHPTHWMQLPAGPQEVKGE
ncbi:DUF551 domain-containing protein [Klebsiella quasivariicola]|uniref:DUF551 domain-containing protein n=1 Tax=Klebsiella quasivariicola TaxID=2026240 RepID=UPI0035B558B8